MKLLCVMVATTSLALIASCGSSGSGSTSVIAPVSAATSYSNASIIGTYSVNLSNGNAETLIGSFTADGNGNITSGSLAENTGAGPAYNCTLTITGTYSIQNTASGTATITSPGLIGCPNGGNSTSAVTFNIQAGQQGQSILFAGSGNSMYAGTAIKQ